MNKITSICLMLSTLLLSGPSYSEEPLVQVNVLSPEAALELAQATLTDCRAAGYQVAVAVVDRMGVSQVVLRDRLAGPHTVDTAQRKAWTAVSFRSDTLSLARSTGPDSIQSGARMIPNVLMLGGGVPVEVAGQLIGAVGVSGATGGNEDDQCARAGIKAVIDKLELSG
jgi:uncharacterized protein GlcG (DUF336 family)